MYLSLDICTNGTRVVDAHNMMALDDKKWSVRATRWTSQSNGPLASHGWVGWVGGSGVESGTDEMLSESGLGWTCRGKVAFQRLLSTAWPPLEQSRTTADSPWYRQPTPQLIFSWLHLQQALGCNQALQCDSLRSVKCMDRKKRCSP